MGVLGPIQLVGRRRGEYPLVQDPLSRSFRVQVRASKVADILAQQGPGLGVIRQGDDAAEARQEYGRQEYQSCQRDPGNALSLDSPLPTPDLVYVGVRPGWSADPAAVLRHKA